MKVNVAEIIEKLKQIKNLKTDKDVASFLRKITPNALNNFKRKNSLGAFLEKVIFVANNKDNSISFDFLLYSNKNTLIEYKNYEPIKKDDKLEEQFELFKSFLNWKDGINKKEEIVIQMEINNAN